MKKNYFILLAMALMLHTTSWSQITSYGGIIEPGTTAGTGGALGNSYFGHQAGLNNTAGWNTFIGYLSGRDNITGEVNLFLGSYSGLNNTSGDRNTFLGHRSGQFNINGAHNTFVGTYSGQNNNSGNYNTFVGIYSGNDNEGGDYNTFIGRLSGQSNISGNRNTYIGNRSGNNNETGSGNVFLGYFAGYNEMGSDLLYIDNSNTDEPLIWGDFTDGSEQLRFNGTVGIDNIPNDNTLTQVLVTDATGNINWRDAASLTTDTHTFPSYPDSAGDLGGNTNSYFGHEAGASIANTGSQNTFIGHQSGLVNETGSWNTFIGYQSGDNNITGSLNAFIGTSSGHNNTSGSSNTFLGYGSGSSNTEGNDNIFIGYNSGVFNTEGFSNTFIGRGSGYSNETGFGNVFLGYLAGYFETESNRLYIDNSDTSEPLIWGNFEDGNEQLRFNGVVGIGNLPQDDALTRILVADPVGNINYREISSLEADLHSAPSYPASAGDGASVTNSYFGHLSGVSAIGTNNTFVGNQSGISNEGDDNSSLGSRTLENNTTGSRNTANGVFTLYDNRTGNENTAVGYSALGWNQQGSYNTATGFQSLWENRASYNTANGHAALSFNYTGEYNTAVGYQALRGDENVLLNTGSHNTAMGNQALLNNTSGNNNVALGREALSVNETGSENIAIGNGSGTNGINFSNTISIGAVATVGEDGAIAIGAGASAGGENSVAIGQGAIINADHEMVLGNLMTAHIRANVMGFSPLSDARFKTNVKENITGLDFIKKLRPVSYQVERTKLHQFLTGKEAPQTVKNDVSMGFIAQEVEQVVAENDYIFTGIKKPANEKDHYGLRYVEFVVPLVKGMQEQQELIENQQQMMETLQQLVETQQQKIEQLENMVYGTGGTSSQTSTQGLKTETTLVKGFSLAQNIPNPFNETTTIVAEIPQTVSEAKIVIYNLQGIELQGYPLSERGRTSVEIKGGSLVSGMYLYALLADGQLIDTKKMILTK